MKKPEPASDRGGALVALVLLLGVVALGLLYWNKSQKDRVIQEQARVIRALGEKLDRAWTTELVADVRVDAVRRETATGTSVMDLTFVQYERGAETPRLKKSFSLPGDEFYVDALTVKFERPLVEAGEGLRGKSLMLFRRAFGNLQRPVDGVPLFRGDAEASVPEVAQVDEPASDFERGIWRRFWQYANDATAAKDAGIRLAHGEAPYVKAVAGQVYKLTLRASGGLEIQPRLPAAVVDPK